MRPKPFILIEHALLWNEEISHLNREVIIFEKFMGHLKHSQNKT